MRAREALQPHRSHAQQLLRLFVRAFPQNARPMCAYVLMGLRPRGLMHSRLRQYCANVCRLCQEGHAIRTNCADTIAHSARGRCQNDSCLSLAWHATGTFQPGKCASLLNVFRCRVGVCSSDHCERLELQLFPHIDRVHRCDVHDEHNLVIADVRIQNCWRSQSICCSLGQFR